MAFITGTNADDVLNGSWTSDILLGYDGNDTLSGGRGLDDLYGGDGDDLMYVYHDDYGYDNTFGGAGIDELKVDINGFVSGFSYFIRLGNSNDVEIFSNESWKTVNILADGFMDLSEFNEVNGWIGTITGSSGADTINGFDEVSHNDAPVAGFADVINAGGGNDKANGFAGNDLINGGSGNDTLTGGTGDDDLTGGTGTDVFRFNDYFAEGTDTISDFEDGVDTIEIFNNYGVTPIPDINQVGSNTEVDWGNGTTIILEGVSATLIDTSDFTFL